MCLLSKSLWRNAVVESEYFPNSECFYTGLLVKVKMTFKLMLLLLKKVMLGDWRDGSVVKSCSSRGPGFNSQHPHGSSQLSVAPIPGDLTPSYQHT